MHRLRKLGVDILEWKKASAFFRRHEGRLREFFSSREIAYIRRSPRRSRAFARLFAAKEAALKALGTPLFGAYALKRVQILPEKNFAVRAAGSRGLRVSFRDGRKHVTATCHPKDSACAGS